jgi:hypothetical protein
VSAARTGPPGARVDRVIELPHSGLGNLPEPFTVMR